MAAGGGLGGLKPGSKLELRGLQAAGGPPAATHVVVMPGKAAGLRLLLDVPSKVRASAPAPQSHSNCAEPSRAVQATGTGSALVLDGRDVALVRAEIIDAAGALVSTSSA